MILLVRIKICLEKKDASLKNVAISKKNQNSQDPKIFLTRSNFHIFKPAAVSL